MCAWVFSKSDALSDMVDSLLSALLIALTMLMVGYFSVQVIQALVKIHNSKKRKKALKARYTTGGNELNTIQKAHLVRARENDVSIVYASNPVHRDTLDLSAIPPEDIAGDK